MTPNVQYLLCNSPLGKEQACGISSCLLCDPGSYSMHNNWLLYRVCLRVVTHCCKWKRLYCFSCNSETGGYYILHLANSKIISFEEAVLRTYSLSLDCFIWFWDFFFLCPLSDSHLYCLQTLPFIFFFSLLLTCLVQWEAVSQTALWFSATKSCIKCPWYIQLD